MKSFNRARLAVALAVLVVRRDGRASSPRSGPASAMAKSATAFLDSLTPEQREKAADAPRLRRSHALELHPDQHVSAAGPPHQGDDRAAAQAGARAPQERRSASAATPTTTTIMNDLEAILRDTEAAARAAKPQRRGPGNIRDPELYFFTVFGTPGRKGHAGAGASKGTTSRCTSPSPTATPSSAAPIFWGTNPAEVREGPKKGLRALDKEQDAGRALMMALDEAQQKTAHLRRSRAERHPDHDRSCRSIRSRLKGVGGVGDDAETARAADAAHRRLHVADDAPTSPPSGRRKSRRRGVEKIAFAWAGPGRARAAALLSRAGTDVPDRVRQHAEQRQPHPLGVARLRERFRPRSAARAPRRRCKH